MKRALGAWLGALALLVVGCKESDPASQKPARQPTVDARHVITVDGTRVSYNGQLLPWEAGIERWQQVLGPRSRLVEGISVWDDLGVFLYHQGPDPDATLPDSFEVLLGRTRHSPLTDTEPDFWPRRTFSGRLVVDGAVITKGSTISQINRDKEGESFRPDHLGTLYSYRLGNGFLVALDFGHDRSLTSFSISRPTPESKPE